MDSPRGAEQRAVVDPHHEPTARRLARPRAICAGPARCEHRRETANRLGSPSLGYLSWRSKKGNWPRAATERAGGTRTNLAKNKFRWYRFVAGHYPPYQVYDPGRASLLRATDYLQLSQRRRPALQRPLINRQVHDGGEHA